MEKDLSRWKTEVKIKRRENMASSQWDPEAGFGNQPFLYPQPGVCSVILRPPCFISY